MRREEEEEMKVIRVEVEEGAEEGKVITKLRITCKRCLPDGWTPGEGWSPSDHLAVAKVGDERHGKKRVNAEGNNK